MGRQLPPSHLKVPPGPHAFPQRYSLGDTVITNQFTGFEKAIPAIPSLPGFRTSAAFFTSLSANLRIDPDLPSPLGTPTTFRTNSYYSSQSHPHVPTSLSYSTLPAPAYPSPLETEIMASSEASAPVQAPTNELPQLSTYTADSEDDRIDGLNLIADSVAQQRQVASKTMIFHPINLAVLGVILAVVAQYVRKHGDPFVFVTTAGGITMSFLIFIRWLTGGYIGLAEEIGIEWLGDDRVIVAKWGNDVIGALVLGWADGDAAKKRGRRRRGKAIVRGWTVKLKYRGKGVGEGLLEEAVKIAGEKGADGILFAGDHANSKRILPTVYNGFLDKQEAKAEKALRKVADEKGNFRQRQSSPTWGSR
ncbi:uncharacterized protein M421DRAFT_166782 [Didymella exigua CBS 183.55]|uniref:N-acetyltransferase domain-containing protein n=1 Tax=Didymella exigua CBS 183.55 TaxID=1150837 RepID=A0A6A5RKR5_9PLEO|nr:uncharacterized protein M421DRAFT_166782 [Didymella exigua CBS 183.55]KAF1928043.1 hypothetical protein M421DRAFT_166782 [Didymella exigua CBS 183.55]